MLVIHDYILIMLTEIVASVAVSSVLNHYAQSYPQRLWKSLQKELSKARSKRLKSQRRALVKYIASNNKIVFSVNNDFICLFELSNSGHCPCSTLRLIKYNSTLRLIAVYRFISLKILLDIIYAKIILKK